MLYTDKDEVSALQADIDSAVEENNQLCALNHRYRSALAWIVDDAAYKAPEQFNDLARRYVDVARNALRPIE